MLTVLLQILLYAAILALIIVVVFYALAAFGVTVPQRIVQLVWVIFLLLVLLMVVRSLPGIVPV